MCCLYGDGTVLVASYEDGDYNRQQPQLERRGGEAMRCNHGKCLPRGEIFTTGSYSMLDGNYDIGLDKLFSLTDLRMRWIMGGRANSQERVVLVGKKKNHFGLPSS
jgi:hypothetical protein